MFKAKLRFKNNLEKSIHRAHHDYASPVTLINSVVHTSKNLTDIEKQMLKKSVQRISQILNELKQESVNASRMETIETNIAQALSQVLDEKKSQVTEKAIEYKCQFSSEFLNTNLSLPKGEMQRCLSNLVQNSIEALPHGGNVSIKGECTEELISLSIKDNGCGIPSELLKRLGRYGETSGKLSGTGIGFAASREFVAALGGRLSIESVVGEWTEVVIRLPLRKDKKIASHSL